MRVITFKLDEELLLRLDLYAINRRISRSEVIRSAILDYLEREMINEKVSKAFRD